MMDEIDQALFTIMIDHDMAMSERDAQKTPERWPDTSDIHITTRARIRALMQSLAPKLAATELRAQAAAQANGSRDFGRGYMHAVTVLEQDDRHR